MDPGFQPEGQQLRRQIPDQHGKQEGGAKDGKYKKVFCTFIPQPVLDRKIDAQKEADACKGSDCFGNVSYTHLLQNL